MANTLANRSKHLIVAIVIAVALPATGLAQTRRPLVTEDVSTLGDRQLEVQIALETVSNFSSPVGPLHGSLLRAPVVGINYGVSDAAEVQLRVPFRQVFWPDGDRTRSATGDATLATKLRLIGGRGIWPGLGARALIKLPNVSERTTIGTDETDVTLELLGGVDLAGATLATSLGIAVLGDPTHPSSQDDKLEFGAGLIVPVGRFHVAADLHGRLLGDSGSANSWSMLTGLSTDVRRTRVDAAVGTLSQGGVRSFILNLGFSLAFRLR